MVCWCVEICFVTSGSSFLYENYIVVGFVKLFSQCCGTCMKLFPFVVAFIECENVGGGDFELMLVVDVFSGFGVAV